LCGNSLGLQPKTTRQYITDELDRWQNNAVHGHFTGPFPWLNIDEFVYKLAATVVGAKPEEVAIMNSLTANLHFMMVPFYRPTAQRFKILVEKRAFPSDTYAVESQIRFHGFDPATSMIEISPRSGEFVLRNEDILRIINEEGDKIALVMFSGLQYYTGQWFEMHKITEAAHKKGCIVGWDLAHAVGNVPLQLHDWDVDFACWCSYKYLNAGPGAIGGCFVHENHARTDRPRFAGWWGHDLQTRFEMNSPFSAIPGAFGFRLSNPCVFSCTALRASLEISTSAGMQRLRKKSLLLTAYLWLLLETQLSDKHDVTIITPKCEDHRGCQLSLVCKHKSSKQLEHQLALRGVIVDSRDPDVIRVAPTPLYNTFEDVRNFVAQLKQLLTRADN